VSGQTRTRAVERTDLPLLRRWRSDPRITRSALGRRFPITEFGEESWYEQLDSGSFPATSTWSIVAGDDSLVGLARLADIDWINRTAWFGIWIEPDSWGNGHASRAATLVCAHGFTEFGLRQIRLHVLESHHSAISVYRRIGFVEEAIMRGAVLIDNEPSNLLQMLVEPAELGGDRSLGSDTYPGGQP